MSQHKLVFVPDNNGGKYYTLDQYFKRLEDSITAIEENIYYYDFSIDETVINNTQNIFTFNYFNEQYENKTSDINYQEKDIPDYYTVANLQAEVNISIKDLIINVDSNTLDKTSTFSVLPKENVRDVKIESYFPYNFTCFVNKSTNVQENQKEIANFWYNLINKFESRVNPIITDTTIDDVGVVDLNLGRILDIRNAVGISIIKQQNISLIPSFNKQTNLSSAKDAMLSLDMSKLTSKVGVLIQKLSGNTLIKNYFSDTLDIKTFIDTQLKYGKKYRYKFFPLIYTNGLQFKVSKTITTQSVPQDQLGNRVEVISSIQRRPETNPISPSTSQTQAPFFDVQSISYSFEQVKDIKPTIVTKALQNQEANITVFAPVPIYPNIEFSTRIDGKNNIDLLVSPFQTDIDDEKILNNLTKNIFSSEESLYSDIKAVFGNKFKISGYDINFIKNYEIYRIDKYPNSYEDFKDGLLRRAKVADQNINSYRVLDTVDFDKRYYYTFRTINKKDIPSPFSEIFEVQLVEDNGIKKLVTNVVELKNNVGLVSDAKQFRRFLKLIPQDEQTRVSEEGKPFISSDKDLYGKTYILKVVSKKTGRIIEYKFKFVRSGNTLKVQQTQNPIVSQQVNNTRPEAVEPVLVVQTPQNTRGDFKISRLTNKRR